MNSIDWKTLGVLSLMFVGVLWFWESEFLFAFKVIPVLAHEFLGHGLAAVCTGGSIDHITLSPRLGGMCATNGGNSFFILPAGYLASGIFGGSLMYIAAKTHWDTWISRILGIGVLIVTLIYIRSIFGFAFGLAFGVALFMAGRKLSEKFNDALLKFIGLTSSMYAVLDIKADLIDRTVAASDASKFADVFFGWPVMWGVIWGLIALATTSFFVYHTVRK